MPRPKISQQRLKNDQSLHLSVVLLVRLVSVCPKRKNDQLNIHNTGWSGQNINSHASPEPPWMCAWPVERR